MGAQQATYEHEKVPQWTSDVIEGVMKKLTGLQKPFKYIGEWAPCCTMAFGGRAVRRLHLAGRWI